MVFQIRLSCRVRHLLQYILLQCLRSEQKQIRMFDGMLGPSSCALTSSISHVMNIRNELWLPTCLIGYSSALLRMRGGDVTCLSACFPSYSSCDQTVQFCRSTAGSLKDTSQSSIRAEFRSHPWRTWSFTRGAAVTLNCSNVHWSAVVIIAPASFKTDSVRSQSCDKDFVQPIDQTVLLSVDRKVVQHCTKERAEKDRVVEEMFACVKCARCGVVFTPSVAYKEIVIVCK